MTRCPLFIVILLVVTSLSADAQTGGSRNSKKPEKRSGTITFDSRTNSSSRSNYSRRKREAAKKNSLSLGIISPLFNGYLPVYYERGLTSFLSVQIGAGPTFRSISNDIGEIVIPRNEENSQYGYQSGTITDDYDSYTYRNTTLGYALSVAPRFYPGHDNAMNGFYLSPVFEYKRYNFEAQLADVSQSAVYGFDIESDVPRSTAVMDESLRCADFLLQIGGHHQTGNHFVIGWSIGLGVRTDQSTRLNLEESFDGSTYHPVNAIREISTTRPLFQFNFVLGQAF